MVEHVRPHHLLQQQVELAEVTEHDVAAKVPGEAGGVAHRARQAAGVVGCLQQQPVAMPQPLQLARTGQAAGTGADDDDPVCEAQRSS